MTDITKPAEGAEDKLIGKKELNSLFWRSCYFDGSFNYERQMSMAVQSTLAPVLKKLYGNDPEKMRAALKRHSEFFNVTPNLAPFMMGVVAAMEEQNATDEDFDTDSINAVKVSLMGPLSGIGDSIFQGTLRPLAGGIAASLAMVGNALAPILFVLMYNIPNFLVRWFGVRLGYGMGVSFLSKAEESGIMQKVFKAAGILGLLTIGGMVAAMVKVNLGLTIGSGDGAIAVADVLNGIMPQILPLGVTLLLSWALRRGMKVNTLMLVIVAVGILGAWTGILVA